MLKQHTQAVFQDYLNYLGSVIICQQFRSHLCVFLSILAFVTWHSSCKQNTAVYSSFNAMNKHTNGIVIDSIISFRITQRENVCLKSYRDEMARAVVSLKSNLLVQQERYSNSKSRLVVSWIVGCSTQNSTLGETWGRRVGTIQQRLTNILCESLTDTSCSLANNL